MLAWEAVGPKVRRWLQGSDMKRYSVQVRGKLPTDMAQRIARLHAFAILQSGRGHTTESGFQDHRLAETDESKRADQTPRNTPDMSRPPDSSAQK